METRKKMVLGAAGALAVAGVVAGTAFANAASPAPGGNQPVPAAPAVLRQAPVAPAPGAPAPATPDAPEANDTPDTPEKAGAPEPGEVAGAPDTDNVQHEATGDEGNHADEPGAAQGAAPK